MSVEKNWKEVYLTERKILKMSEDNNDIANRGSELGIYDFSDLTLYYVLKK